MMKRREFITLLSGAAAAWPLAARAQQPERVRRIGVLMNLTESDSEGQARIAAFREGLGKLGWTEGREVQIEYRWTGGDPDRARAYAAELVKLKPDVIFAAPASSLAPLQRETAQCAHRIRTSRRSGRGGVGRELGTTWRQHHWVRSI